MSAADHLQGRQVAPTLFEMPVPELPERDYEPGRWVDSPDVVWHASKSPTPPDIVDEPNAQSEYEVGNFVPKGQFHVGTLPAAVHRTGAWHAGLSKSHIHPYTLGGQFALAPPQHREDPEKFTVYTNGLELAHHSVFSDLAANMEKSVNQHRVETGHNIPYANSMEAAGDVSFVVGRAGNVATWAESVLADPHAPQHLKNLASEHDLVVRPTGTGGPWDEWHPSSTQLPLPGLGGEERHEYDMPEGFTELKRLDVPHPHSHEDYYSKMGTRTFFLGLQKRENRNSDED